WQKKAKAPACRTPRPRLEELEGRLTPANLDYTALVQSLGGYPHPGPTHLYLNFDGTSANNVAAFTGTNNDVQEVLYRTSEIFAPFNVEVSRMYGFGNYDAGSNGNTTIFVGNNNTQSSFTDFHNTDQPNTTNGSGHRPDSEPYHVGFVDPRALNGL